MSVNKQESITLPWPDKDLSPNSRVHWREKSHLTRSAKEFYFWVALEELGIFNIKPSKVDVYFYPPDKRRRDKLNMVASFKAAQDGIADAIKWDDQYWDENYHVEESAKGGAIKVVFKWDNEG